MQNMSQEKLCVRGWSSTESQPFPEPYGLFIPSRLLPLEQFCCEHFFLNLHPYGLENINCGTLFAQEAESKTNENSVSFTEFLLKEEKKKKAHHGLLVN